MYMLSKESFEDSSVWQSNVELMWVNRYPATGFLLGVDIPLSSCCHDVEVESQGNVSRLEPGGFIYKYS